MKNKLIGIILIVLILALAGVYWIGMRSGDTEMSVVQSFQECVNAGNPVMETYPEQCRTSAGKTFVNPDQIAPTNETATSSGDNVSSPSTGSGQADTDEQVFCTMEAKLCPDGSYVGRSGPKCEFAPCPGQ